MAEAVVWDGATTRMVATNGVELQITEAGSGPLVLLVHGFPELGYSWRHQFPALTSAGLHVVAPDQRGYGGSSRPEAVDDYDIVSLTDDLVGLLDALGHERAVVVGHDWGSMVAWGFAQLHPERTAGVAGLSVPFVPRGPVPPLELMSQLFGDSFFYILYFQEPGVADADLGADVATTMRRMLAGLTLREGGVDLGGLAAPDGRGFVDRLPEPDALPDWLTPEELDHYVAEFTRTGFTGGINWYRNFDRNWASTPQLEGAKVTVPSMFLTGTLDPVAVMSPSSIMDGWLEDHRGSTFVDGAGHWVQQERPDEVDAALLEFIAGLDLG